MKVLLLNKPLTPNEYKDLVMNHDAWFLTAQYCREDIELQYEAMKDRDALVIPSSTEFIDLIYFASIDDVRGIFRIYNGIAVKELPTEKIISIWRESEKDFSTAKTSTILRSFYLI